MTGTPPADIEVSQPLVRQLIADQHPDLSILPIEKIDAGWDNVMFSLGPSLAVRMPRRQVAAGLIENEQRWLPMLAPGLPLPVPAPIRIGQPGRDYPWRWSIVPWIAGQPADLAPPNALQAIPLANFLRKLHVPASVDAPVNPFRAAPLAHREREETRLKRLREKTSSITPAIEQAWNQGICAAPATERCWLHADLHPGNVLIQEGAITAIIDWGDITAGDPAIDLASIWMLLADPGARRAALAHYSPPVDTIARAKAWAVLFGAVLLDHGLVDNPRHAAIGVATLGRVHQDQASMLAF